MMPEDLGLMTGEHVPENWDIWDGSPYNELDEYYRYGMPDSWPGSWVFQHMLFGKEVQ
jgi:hypothetical protein